MLKPEARIIGIDDSMFDKHADKEVLVIGVIFRGGSFLDGVLTTRAEVDGSDATDKLAMMINTSKFKVQLQCIMLDGIAVGGFNIVDVAELHHLTSLPVIVVMRDYPIVEEVVSALRMLGMESKIPLLKKAGEIVKIDSIHIQFIGMGLDKAQELIKLTCTHSHIPEPLRVAHLIGQGITMGESRGRA
jgi:uncharacterized protein